CARDNGSWKDGWFDVW
nr:immunoglobulin heavy chain junction region [Macaca mulatta]MPN69771.1 immunoglobulin heavy chain junction region [Macaca mulatta]MPN69851.1 immunoglobulin heavy chain junction region [Macaca mulatta]MPN69854.1 immunoglobulin heavy chain junction region [Macaca mulatta]MPN70164.1 immunoglobulin heavy chain junction region [Macaca mulatta]